jgi:DNA replication and repair protein RecF
MYLEKLSVLNYKNYGDCSLEFNSRVNVFVGRNGSGKTNLLDIIHYLSMTKSAFTSSDNQCIKVGENFFMIKATFRKEHRSYDLMASCQTGSKKIFRENQLDYEKLSGHIGKYPVVLIAPDDSDLVRDGSEIRRKFFDSLISQCDPEYLEGLIVYSHALKQRNGLLRIFQDAGRVDNIALESYDRLLIHHGTHIYNKRKAFLGQFIPTFQKYYQILVDGSEMASIQYLSGVSDQTFAEGLKKNLQRDLVLLRTNFGIHRDDFLLMLSGDELKKFGSQGQQKSFVIALKLAQFEVLQTIKGFPPLLLLDDIFDKLDDLRIGKLMEIVRNGLGQLFITDARPARTFELLSKIGVEAAVYDVEAGRITSVKSSGGIEDQDYEKK